MDLNKWNDYTTNRISEQDLPLQDETCPSQLRKGPPFSGTKLVAKQQAQLDQHHVQLPPTEPCSTQIEWSQKKNYDVYKNEMD